MARASRLRMVYQESNAEMGAPGTVTATQAADRAHTIGAAIGLSVFGMASFLLMPLMVASAIQSLHYSDRQVGVLASLLAMGTMVSAVAAGFWVRRVSWHLAACFSLLGLFASSAASILFHGSWPFLTAQCLSGFFGGSLYSLALTVLADGRHPDRSFGFSVSAQVGFTVAGLLAGPSLLRVGGINAVLSLVGGLCLVGLALVPALPTHGRVAAAADQGKRRLLTAPLLYALAGCFLFFFNVNCYWTYVGPIGAAAGLSERVIANDIAIGVAIGIAGSLLASWWGERYGRTRPIGVAAVLIVAAVLMLPYAANSMVYLVSSAIYNFAWNLSLSYQYAAVNAVDDTGRGIAVAPAFHSGGAAAGPAIAALLITTHNYHIVYWLSSVAVIASFAIFALSAAYRSRRPAITGRFEALLR
jgi:MFS transporter, DHA1 family, inner membrane transport protein